MVIVNCKKLFLPATHRKKNTQAPVFDSVFLQTHTFLDFTIKTKFEVRESMALGFCAYMPTRPPALFFF